MILDAGKDAQQDISSPLIKRIVSLEQLPLPMFALHFLEQKATGSPLAVLDAARELRDSPDIVKLRKWLAKWEVLYNSGDLDRQAKALHKIEKLRCSLQPMNQDHTLYSVLRPEVSSGPDGSFGATFDLSGLAEPIIELIRRFSRRRILLAALRREVVADRELGARLCRIIGRAMSP